MLRLLAATALAGGLICTQMAMAQTVADGSTDTFVTVNPDGSVTVGIAPTTRNGVSLNRYTAFNAPKPGLQLDNRSEAARTIVNEVTGTGQSLLEGPVEVLGQRAHVILANPNGIVIDGGRFVNTGRVALTTGTLSTHPQQIAPGVFQDNIVATVQGGTIRVSGGGLSGQMDAVDLIADSLHIAGTVDNTGGADGASVQLLAGQNRVEFDSSVLPGNVDLTWGRISSLAASSPGAVLVEIDSGGALRANRVLIEVSDIGAGVRIAGEGLARSREFSLQADGQITVTAAKLSGQSGVFLSGGAVTVDHSTVAADAGVISVGAKGDISDVESLFMAAQSIVFTTQGGLRFTDTTIKSAASVQLDVTGDLHATGAVIEAVGHIAIAADQAEFRRGKLATQITAANGALVITTRGAASSGDLRNIGGTLTGAQMAEGLTDPAGTASAGAVTLNVAGSLFNTTTDQDVAIIFGGAGNVAIRAGANLENTRGRILANGNIGVIATGNVLNLVPADAKATAPEITQYSQEGKRIWWTLWIKRQRDSGVTYDFGTIAAPDKLATITAAKGISITAHSVVNQGGSINANDGDLTVQAVRVETIGLGSGRVSVRRICALTCSYDSSGSVAILGGQMMASGRVSITATERFSNRAGTVFAGGDVTLTAAEVVLEAAIVPLLVERPRGLYNFWSSRAAWVFLREQFGGVISDTGRIVVNSAAPVRILGGTFDAAAGVQLQSGQVIVRPPVTQAGALGHSIGLFAHLPLIRQH